MDEEGVPGVVHSSSSIASNSSQSSLGHSSIGLVDSVAGLPINVEMRDDASFFAWPRFQRTVLSFVILR